MIDAFDICALALLRALQATTFGAASPRNFARETDASRNRSAPHAAAARSSSPSHVDPPRPPRRPTEAPPRQPFETPPTSPTPPGAPNSPVERPLERPPDHPFEAPPSPATPSSRRRARSAASEARRRVRSILPLGRVALDGGSFFMLSSGAP